jgi:hypothetical protein
VYRKNGQHFAQGSFQMRPAPDGARSKRWRRRSPIPEEAMNGIPIELDLDNGREQVCFRRAGPASGA